MKHISQPEQPTKRASITAVPQWLLLWILTGLLALCGIAQALSAWSELTSSGMDLQQDYMAAQRLRAGESLYAPFEPREIVALGVREELNTGMRQNVHPPPAVLLFVPLTLMPFTWATLVWTVLTIGLLFGCLWVLIDWLCLPIAGAWRWLVPLLMLNWYPVWLHLHLGQWTVLLLVLIIGAWWCLQREHDYMAGGLLAAAALIKLYPLFLLGYLLIRRRWRAVATVAGVIMAIVGLQMAIDAQPWHEYLGSAMAQNAREWTPRPRNASLSTISTRLFTGSRQIKPLFDLPAAELPTRLALYALALGSFGLALWRGQEHNLTGEYSLTIAAMSLLAPISWPHAFILLLLPLGYIWQQARADPQRHRAALAWGKAALLLTIMPYELVLQYVQRRYQPGRMPALVGLLDPHVFVMLCCFIAMLLVLRRGSSGEAPGDNHMAGSWK